MAAQAIKTTLQRLHSAGLRLTLTPGNGLKVSPASSMNDAMRALIVAHKAEIVAYLSEAANDPVSSAAALDPDRHCCPHSPAMNSVELERFTARLARFTDHDVAQLDAEGMADRLVIRDREHDDRATCLECTHLQRGWRCGNWQLAGVAIHARDAQLAGDFVRQLQRCDGFTQSIHFQGGNHG